MVSMAFDSCTIIKPFRSRQGNSEKYLIGRGFRKGHTVTEKIIEHLSQLHIAWQYEQIATVVLPADILINDNIWPGFEHDLRRLNELCCSQQQHAVQVIMDTVAKQIPLSFALSYRTNINNSLVRLSDRIRQLRTESSTPGSLQRLARLQLLRSVLCRDAQLLSRRSEDSTSFSVVEAEERPRFEKHRRLY